MCWCYPSCPHTHAHMVMRSQGIYMATLCQARVQVPPRQSWGASKSARWSMSESRSRSDSVGCALCALYFGLGSAGSSGGVGQAGVMPREPAITRAGPEPPLPSTALLAVGRTVLPLRQRAPTICPSAHRPRVCCSLLPLGLQHRTQTLKLDCKRLFLHICCSMLKAYMYLCVECE